MKRILIMAFIVFLFSCCDYKYQVKIEQRVRINSILDYSYYIETSVHIYKNNRYFNSEYWNVDVCTKDNLTEVTNREYNEALKVYIKVTNKINEIYKGE
jgi:hypothetical protein